jgi:hypothetical protein
VRLQRTWLYQYLIKEHQAEFVASVCFRLMAGLRNFSSPLIEPLPEISNLQSEIQHLY